ncbi:DNA cytosine methyltransferase [Sulfurimonas sp.]|uniref:DNA cytosine methyltransferase n=1 Tax=Sulfurimonas sp. TaxID=2022749 RepID=UPI0025D8E840|nr:DNA cytosine methyltransferase [Sulfurimonas sp.]
MMKHIKKLKILNLYAGIGGNRKLWNEVNQTMEVVAVEYDKHIAKAYQDRFPNDTVIVGCAKEYLLNHYKEFDFIWVSPPCQTHTRILYSSKDSESYKPKYPDMSLYQVILFLQLHTKRFKYVVENVRPYYEPLLKPSITIDRHMYWSNFNITTIKVDKMYIHNDVTCKSLKDFDIRKYRNIKNKRQVIRNQVNYEIGKHILECSLNILKKVNSNCTQATLF